jgi:hypothetical protein
MNATIAMQQNEEMVNDLLFSSKKMAANFNISVIEAIDKKIKVYQKIYPQSALAWFLRGEEAKRSI